MKWKGTLAIIRNAERADFPKSNSLPTEAFLIPEDPPLTFLGLHQARKTAQTFWNLGLIHDQSKIILLSSPFYRAMQTSAEIAKFVGLPQFFVDYGFMQILHKKDFARNPIPQLKIRNTMLQNQIGVAYQELSYEKLPEFPEEFEACENRFKKSFEDLINALDNGLQGDLVIIVTHLFGLDCLSQLIGGTKTQGQYSSMTVCKRTEEGKFKLLLDEDDSHLKEEDKSKLSFFKNLF